MRILSAVPIIFFLFLSSIWAAEPEGLPHLDPNDPAALREAVRLLTAEIQLAARPRTYVVIDLVAQTIFIKGRGLELHRLPIEHWTASRLADIASSLRLQERPPVTRRKLDPAAGADQSPISLEDMPSQYCLSFFPSLRVTIQPSLPHNLWQWLTFNGQEWWRWLKIQWRTLVSGDSASSAPSLQLTLAHDDAQSLAWTVTDDMPFLIRRTSSP
jgi:hypothetical protein